MAKGNNNHGRGGSRGPSRGNPTGQRGRGRGRGRGSGGGPGRDAFNHLDDPMGFDFDLSNRGFGSPRARGQGRGLNFRPNRSASNHRTGIDTHRGPGHGRGYDTTDDFPANELGRGRKRGRGRGRGMGYLNSKLRAGAPLSKVLYEDRPLLKPIVFVRSVHTATLFKEEEDILQPLAEPVADDGDSHVPTADKVTRVFSGTQDALDDAEEEERLEEIDFADIGKIQEAIDVAAVSVAPKLEKHVEEEQLDVIDFADIGKIQAAVDAATAAVTSESKKQTEGQPGIIVPQDRMSCFYVDTTPASAVDGPANKGIIQDKSDGILGEQQEDDEIVYVAPYPRSGRIISAVSASATETVATTSILTGLEISETRREDIDITDKDTPTTSGSLLPEPPALSPPPSFHSISFSFDQTPRKRQASRVFPVGGPRSLLKRSKKARRKSLHRFGSFGAMLSEAHLQEEAQRTDPRESEQRRGDSDVNWGDSDSDRDGGIEELSNGVGAMDLDEDADITVEAMKSFVNSMSTDRHVTMDDIADIQRMQAEDAEEAAGDTPDVSSDESEDSNTEDQDESEDEDKELDRVIAAEERALIGEDDSEDEEDEDEDSSDEERTPTTRFRSKLTRIRAKAQKGHKVEDQGTSSDEAMSVQMIWPDEDDESSAETEGGRKAKKPVFHAVANGDFEDDEYQSMLEPAPRRKDKHVPTHLQAQWDKDREKKAENKRKRAQDRIAAAADPLAIHKGGKKGRKAMLAAIRLDDSADIPNRVIDLITLEQQIRRFLEDIGRRTMALPPADKETRKNIHELADAFNLKSQSKNKGQNRYTTLTKTTMSGISINERKIRAILKKSTNSWNMPGRDKVNSKKVSLAKHREGEEVGKAAPKIGQSNVGFKMLAAMGWAEGERIGLSGGLEAPLTAIMKKTKLGLGATM